MIYTGIGSRETPYEITKVMFTIAHELATHDWTLRSGHAEGADQAFERGAKQAKGAMEIYLPWDGFEGARANHGKNTTQEYWVPSELPMYEEAEQIAAMFHPRWDLCKQGARKLHTRNVYQVVGRSLEEKSDLVICWTKDGKGGGGTGQALRIAEYLEIPIFDLAVCSLDQIASFINEKRP